MYRYGSLKSVSSPTSLTLNNPLTVSSCLYIPCFILIGLQKDWRSFTLNTIWRAPAVRRRRGEKQEISW